MSKRIIDRLEEQFGERLLQTNDFRGDEEVRVAPADWHEVALFLRDDPACAMNMFTDLTAADYPEREPEPRFDVLVFVQSLETKARVRLKTRVAEGQKLATLADVWAGANWTEREVFDMFGIEFEGHPDLRRILLYPEFSGYPLRKDYPIERTQPLVAYRKDVPGIEKLPPFGPEEGQPYSRIDWEGRLSGGNQQVSPAIALQQGQRRALSESGGEPALPASQALPASEEE